MNTSDIKRDDWIVLGLALLLFIDLVAFSWVSGGCYLNICVSGPTATGSPDSFFGILAVISTVLVLVDLGIERLSPETAIPNIGGSRTKTRLALAGATAVFLLCKFIFPGIHLGVMGFGFWGAIVLTAGLVYYTLTLSKA
jgi:hypothetical protein